MADVKNLDNH